MLNMQLTAHLRIKAPMSCNRRKNLLFTLFSHSGSKQQATVLIHALQLVSNVYQSLKQLTTLNTNSFPRYLLFSRPRNEFNLLLIYLVLNNEVNLALEGKVEEIPWKQS